MNKKEIEELLKRAQDCYSSGKYKEALETWRSVLEQDSGNKQALEGVRMAEVISDSWLPEKSPPSEETAQGAEEAGEDPSASGWDGAAGKDQTAEETQSSVAVATAESGPAEEAPKSAKGDSADERVHEMIMEAEGLIKEKNYVKAIDKLSEAWSLDEMNLAVQDLMNIARSLLEMDNKKIQEKLATAMGHFEKKEFDTAEGLFKEILSINPDHREALSYLEKIDHEKKKDDSDKVPTSYVDEGAFEQEECIKDHPEETVPGEGSGEIVEEKTDQWPGETVKEKAEAEAEWAEDGVERGPEEETGEWTEEKQEQKNILEKAEAPPVRRKRSYTWILYPMLTALVLAAGIYFSRDFIFGLFLDSSGSRPDSVGSDSKAGVTVPIPPVTKQPEAGTSDAEALAPDGGSSDETQGRETGQLEGASPGVNLSSSEIKVKVRELIKEGKALASSGQPVKAQERFKEAMLLDPLSIEAKRLHADTSKVVADLRQKDEKMNNAIQLFEEQQYEEALKLLYRLPGSNKDPIQRYIINSWYNLGILNLTNASVVEAKKCFEEVLMLNPYDQDAQQEMKFTEWYTSHRIDESFGHHVKTLTYRKITD